MMMHEWTERTDHTPTPEEWTVIHTVYNFSSSIPDVGGKDVISQLYKVGGLRIIRDMYPNAKRQEAIDTRLIELDLGQDRLDQEQKEEEQRIKDQLQAIRDTFRAKRGTLETERADLLREKVGFSF